MDEAVNSNGDGWGEGGTKQSPCKCINASLTAAVLLASGDISYITAYKIQQRKRKQKRRKRKRNKKKRYKNGCGTNLPGYTTATAECRVAVIKGVLFSNPPDRRGVSFDLEFDLDLDRDLDIDIDLIDLDIDLDLAFDFDIVEGIVWCLCRPCWISLMSLISP